MMLLRVVVVVAAAVVAWAIADIDVVLLVVCGCAR